MTTRSVYGLGQAPPQWYNRLASKLLPVGFKIIHLFQNEFMLKDLGALNYFLGIEATHTSHGLLLTQSKYILYLLTKANMAQCNTISTPANTNKKLSQAVSEPAKDPHLYRTIVGGLQYLSLTRPNISFSVNKVSQFVHNPTETHKATIERILRYLKATMHHGVFLSKLTSSALNVYSDADWASSLDDWKSTSGYAIFMGSNLISWSVRKQNTVACSSTEAEHHAVGAAATEVVWIQSLLREISQVSPIVPILWCDNIGVTYLSANPLFHACMKHIEVEFHYVHDLVTSKQLQVWFLSLKDQLVDVLKEALT
ncbi:hypothetical protein GH714_020592 [Hevea brasiliensis]|uniref:Reverse transcriptase Ty1/copia-type domain-containing protein n=1 Tax=Hevea brasiliensis TaxID=3981 RepID=A0A6A6MJJ2_HEVBR|nr:hypothetical protein GH714_020592 [Hevea brasiliensis]